jgi:hypothetical protein
VTYWLPAQRGQAGLDASLVQLTTRRINDQAGRVPEILRDLMELARQVSDDASIAGQRRNENAVARRPRVCRRGRARPSLPGLALLPHLGAERGLFGFDQCAARVASCERALLEQLTRDAADDTPEVK